MVIPRNNEFYLQKNTDLLQKLESVIDTLILKAEKAEGKHKTNLQHHVIKIQVKKARTDVILRKLKRKENEEQDDLKNNFEISLKKLKKALSNASSMSSLGRG
jgi:hypothetical protein